ncbi:hypothetical protein LCGC14_2590510 [marine sediment metagenome]|uniref:Uncharacterized protein n=1 Tax=marine sediment metagenome TaxID=412755 RepID=A0A0F9AC46_9ZZZZ
MCECCIWKNAGTETKEKEAKPEIKEKKAGTEIKEKNTDKLVALNVKD